MKIGIVRLGRVAGALGAAPTAADVASLALAVERLGFAGLWTTDSVGRGRATLDPLTVLAVAAGVTSRIELGTCILQLPLRPPVELAHRIRSLDQLSAGRLRLGVGPGSTRADFDLIGADFEGRFKALYTSLDRMRRVWAGEAVNDVTLAGWPGTAPEPQILLGGWRSQRTIARAAETCAGWIASGLHSEWDDLDAGIRAYRAAGGKRAVLANVHVNLREGAPPPSGHVTISLVCPPAEARIRLRRIADLGFDDVLLIPPDDAAPQLEAIQALVSP